MTNTNTNTTTTSNEDFETQMRDRIMHVLGIYPELSPSMLQIGMGTSLSPTLWKPILDKMITEGRIVRDDLITEAPNGALRHYSRLHLA